MADFTNKATLSYGGRNTVSNTVRGTKNSVFGIKKEALVPTYVAGEMITYLVSVTNNGTHEVENVYLKDDLGRLTSGAYPLEYVPDSIRMLIRGVQTTDAPAVKSTQPLVVGPMTIPAGEGTLLVYEARVTDAAPLASGSTIKNTVTLPVDIRDTNAEASAIITVRSEAYLSISKAMNPSDVTEGDKLTYTFTIENAGNVDAGGASDPIIISDVFDPYLRDIAVTFNGTATDAFEYNTLGLFTTKPELITVSKAAYATAPNGTLTVTPGTSTLVVTGTV